MRTTVTMSTAETANAAPDHEHHRLDAEQAEQQAAQHRAHGAQRADLADDGSGAHDAVAPRTMNDTAACTVGWYALRGVQDDERADAQADEVDSAVSARNAARRSQS